MTVLLLVDIFLSLATFLLPLAHIVVSPFTKVEESFNLQATHDILIYGTPTSSIRSRIVQTYDHFTFPGAVPRTFVGSVVLAGVSQPIVAAVGFAHAQLVVRCVLAGLNAVTLLVFRRAAAAAFGAPTARWWLVLVLSQFHVVYYLGRTLPNMFAFGLTTLALAFTLPKPSPRVAALRARQALSLLTFAGVVFRGEIAILLLAVSGQLLVRRQISFRSLVAVGVGSFLGSLVISVSIDSYFWQKPLWPELWAFYFNAVRGQSSNWGTEPWHYYFTSALPRLLLNPLALPLVAMSCLHPLLSRQARTVVLPSLLYVAIYSLQPHKETRFVMYTVPSFTLAAALSANFIAARASKSVLYRLSCLAVAASVLAASAASIAMLLLSTLNYPGGDALTQLYAHVGSSQHPAPEPVNVHADVLTCMTGLTLFNQNRQGLALALGSDVGKTSNPAAPVYFFDKTEKSERLGWPSFWQKFDYVLLEDPALALGQWDLVGVVDALNGLEVLRPGQPDPSEQGRDETLGHGARVARWRRRVRSYTGGWWIGPRMSSRIHIMRKKHLV